MKAIITIDSREAIPVRMLPYVTNWSESPDSLARVLAGRDGMPKRRIFTAFQMDDGHTHPVMLQEWDRVIDKIEFQTSGLKATESFEYENYGLWETAAVKELLAGVFVWHEEFAKWFEETHGEEALTTVQTEPYMRVLKRKGDNDLNLWPNIPRGLRPVVIEGFEAYYPPVPDLKSAEPMTICQAAPIIRPPSDKREEHDYAAMANGSIEIEQFLWLTKTEIGVHGQYLITANGIVARAAPEAENWDLSDMPREEAEAVEKFIRQSQLRFPCTSQNLVSWVNSINLDFQLPAAFSKAVSLSVVDNKKEDTKVKAPKKPWWHAYDPIGKFKRIAEDRVKHGYLIERANHVGTVSEISVAECVADLISREAIAAKSRGPHDKKNISAKTVLSHVHAAGYRVNEIHRLPRKE